MVKKPEKNFVSIPELANRWNWQESEVCELILQGKLVPSWYFNKYDAYQLYELSWDEEINDFCGTPLEGSRGDEEELLTISIRAEGFYFLIQPKRTSPTTCDFWLFSNTNGPFSSGDSVHHLPSPISLLEVKQRGIVMIAEVEKYEQEFKSHPENHEQQNQFKPMPRFSAQDAYLLKQIKLMEIDPKQLPKNQPGRAGIKSKIRQSTSNNYQLFTGTRVFDKAWERLLVNGDIAYQKT
jgi:hypothetical protein